MTTRVEAQGEPFTLGDQTLTQTICPDATLIELESVGAKIRIDDWADEPILSEGSWGEVQISYPTSLGSMVSLMGMNGVSRFETHNDAQEKEVTHLIRYKKGKPVIVRLDTLKGFSEIKFTNIK